jgi:hypothetical protein
MLESACIYLPFKNLDMKKTPMFYDILDKLCEQPNGYLLYCDGFDFAKKVATVEGEHVDTTFY